MRHFSLIVFLFGLVFEILSTSILTQNGDMGRTGWNSKETALTASTVPNLKKLNSVKLAGPCTTQVLYYENLNLNGHKDVLFCWTNNDNDNSNTTAYAIDASTLDQIWALYVGQGALWATHAPVIDTATNYMYFVYKNDNDDGYNYLIGIDIIAGKFLPGSHILINATVPGTGAASVNGELTFQNTATGNGVRIHNDCRTSLLVVNSVLYFGFAHNSDSYPYHGWGFSYKYDTASQSFVQLSKWCSSPNSQESGVWQGGHGFASDGSSFFLTVGNGDFNPSQNSWGMGVIRMSLDFQIQDYFVPANWKQYSDADLDLGGCGPTLIPNTSYIFVGVTKYGSVHLINKNNMGKWTSGKDSCRQTINLFPYDSPGGNPVAMSLPDGSAKIFTWAPGHPIYQFNYNPNTQMLDNPIQWTGASGGGGLQITSNGDSNPILWAMGAGRTYAFDLTKDISNGPIWSIGILGPSSWGWPTISNGKLYIPSWDSTLTVFGL